MFRKLYKVDGTCLFCHSGPGPESHRKETMKQVQIDKQGLFGDLFIIER